MSEIMFVPLMYYNKSFKTLDTTA